MSTGQPSPMRLFVHSSHRQGDAFVVVPNGTDYVAFCVLEASEEFAARNALRSLCSMGTFLLPTRQLRYAVRDGTNPTCADIYDALNGIGLPASYTNGPLSLCNIVSPNVVIVVDDAVAEKALEESLSQLSSPTAAGSRLIRVATMGFMPVWDNTRQTFTLIHDARTGRIVAAADVSKLFASLKVVAENAAIDAIVIAFASSIGEGLSRPAMSVPFENKNGEKRCRPKASVNSMAFVGSNELFHYVSSVIRTMMSCQRMATYPPLASASRCIVGHAASLVPLVAPVGDAQLVREFGALIRGFDTDDARMGGRYDVKCAADVSALPFSSLSGSLEWRRGAAKDQQPPQAPAVVASFEELLLPQNGAPSGILRLGNQPATCANYVNLSDLKLAKGEIQNGVLHVTSLPVDYYHYRVDGFADDGWGCAYRASQLILSWLQRRGLMKASMPSIRGLQQVLKEVDPAKGDVSGFVGGSEWIGSYEVMLLIQHYCTDVECTIQRVETGKEIDVNPAIQRVLAAHFEKGGCPVVIGGGSYAYTILGINANIRTSEAQYLIADPHYSASSPDASTVSRKGWVGWKDMGKFLKGGAWYNLCIPRVYSPQL